MQLDGFLVAANLGASISLLNPIVEMKHMEGYLL